MKTVKRGGKINTGSERRGWRETDRIALIPQSGARKGVSGACGGGRGYCVFSRGTTGHARACLSHVDFGLFFYCVGVRVRVSAYIPYLIA